MTMKNWETELVEKKRIFSDREFSELSSEQSCAFSNIYNKFWFVYTKTWGLEKTNKSLEQQRETLKNTKKKVDIGLLVFLVVMAFISYFRDASNLERDLMAMSAVLYYFWHINLIYSEDKIHHITILMNKQTIDLLNVSNSNLKLYLVPEAYRYMSIYDKYEGRFTEELNEDEQLVIKTFNVELDLAIMQSLGIKIPNIWS